MEPSKRITLQTIYNTFVDAGYTRETLAGTKTGVFIGYAAGSIKDSYVMNISFRYPGLMKYAMTGNMPALMPSRISQMLDLHGPTMILDTACSSSLFAVHLACESIHNGDAEMAIAGGIKLNILPMILEDLKLGIESVDDCTRAFDNDASGTGIGEGSFCVLLKPLAKAEEDGDHIYGVIKSTAVNHDGTASGLTAPNPSAQSEVIENALRKANVTPEDISYVEVHGTATLLGDPIEFQGLNHAYRKFTSKKQFCALSASKSNLGHLYECAGVAALVKALAALNNKKIPGSKHFNVPNVKIDFSNSPFYVNKYTKQWNIENGKKRTCGVSAFGLSGTNCHLILQEYTNEKANSEQKKREDDILCISAFSEESLSRLVKRYTEFIQGSDADINNITYNINVYRQHYKYRLAVVFSGKEDMLNKLKQYEISGSTENIPGLYVFNEQGNEKSDGKDLCRACNEAWNAGEISAQERSSLIEKLNELARFYAGGKDIDWKELYRNMETKKISLPIYPFHEYHLWLEENEDSIARSSGIRNLNAQNKNVLTVNTSEVKEKEAAQEEPVFYQKIQVREELEAAAKNTSNDFAKDILIVRFGNAANIGIGKSLEEDGYSVQTLDLKVTGEKLEDCFMQQFCQFSFSDISKVVFCFGDLVKDGRTLSVNDAVATYMLAVICLYRSVAQDLLSSDGCVQLFCVTENAFYLPGQKAESRPEYSSIAGMCKALNRGFPYVKAECVDVDDKISVKALKEEILASITKDIVYYRENARYIEGIQEFTGKPQNRMTYRNGGVYVITGGLGGIGFETAKELIGRAENCTVALLGRTELPPREKWEEVLSGDNQDMAEKINRLLELEKLGKVVYLPCNMGNYDQVVSCIDQIKNKYGKINGIFHTAGVGGGTEFVGLNEERVRKMITAKIVGAYALDIATANDKLDFFVVFSSISTVFSSIDLPDYIAANLYLEEFAAWRSRKREGVSVSIEWATWAETGMSVKNNFTFDTMFKSITTKRGMQSLFEALELGQYNLIAGQLNFDSKIILLIYKYPVKLSDYIEGMLKKLKEKPAEGNSGVSSASSSYTEIEDRLCKICCEVLGYDTVDITDNFFELGADSIMLGHIFKEVDAVYPNILNVTDMFAYPTVELLTEYLASKVTVEEKKEVVVEEGQDTVEEPEEESEEEEAGESDIAIIGVGMKLPNASSLDEYWEVLNNGINVVREIPKDRSVDVEKHLRSKGMKASDIHFLRCGYLDRINTFDHTYFGMSPKESSMIEPAGRLFLQACATAIEDAGYGGDSIRGTQTGVFLGYTANIGNAYSRLLYETDRDLFGESMPVNQVSMMASRIAYTYDLKGPSMVIDTACSSSLVALHTACKQIRSGECDMALAGGVSIMMTPLSNGASIGFESPEYKTRAFADNSSGTAVGEGVCAILLKPLKKAKADGDSIYAVIKGSAINQDGRSQGIAAPNYLAQSAAITKAWEDAGVSAEDISYIEAHGTGTQLGDPIEIRGITHAFAGSSVAAQSCGIGSLKTNIGHLNEASGMSGILKIILMFKHKMIPASLQFKIPNSNIDFAESPLHVVSIKKPLKAKKGKALVGINGFGMSGTNCHVILQEPPVENNKKNAGAKQCIFTASAKTKQAFVNIVQHYLDYLKENEKIDLSDFCFTANVGRTHFPYRLAVCVRTREELIDNLEYVLKNYGNAAIACTGSYSIVPENKKERAENEITSRMQKQMTAQASDLLEEIRNTGNYARAQELVSLYVKGASVNWMDLYSEEKHRHIHIPVYPFEQFYCWYKIPEVEEEPSDTHFEKRWIPFENADEKKFNSDEYVVVFLGKDDKFGDLPQELEKKGAKVCTVKYGDSYEKLGEDLYSAGQSVEDYTQLFQELNTKKISKMIHMKAVFRDEVHERTAIENRLDSGFFDVISFMKGMAKARFNTKFDLILVANSVYAITGQEDLLLPENATLLSIGTVIEQENPNIDCYAIDIDMHSDSESICRQIMSMDRTYYDGIRNNQFFQMENISSRIPAVKDEVIKAGEVYVITGGTGGIGSEIAKYVAQQNPAKIVLLSRKGFEPQENWEKLKQKQEYAHQIEIFEEIIRLGSTLQFEKCDITDKEDVTQCIDRIHRKYGRITAVFHTAGISGAGYILRKEKESFVEVLKPKLYGTIYLDQLTADDNLDFMMICSSAVTDSGEAGQSDYVAANAYLDAYTDYRNALGRATYTVNWVSWKETGMSVRHGINVDGVTKALGTKDAIEALDKMLRGEPRRAMIGQYNMEMDLSVFVKYSRCKSEENMLSLAMQNTRQSSFPTSGNAISDGSRDIAKVTNGKMMFIPKSDKVGASSKNSIRVKLTGDSDGNYTALEQTVGNIYGKTLGYDEINVYDNFFELGGDSIMLSGMYDLLCDEFDEVITVADLFEYTSIRELAKLIAQNLPEDTAREESAETEQKTEEESCFPLSMPQSRIYYDSRLSRDKYAYNNPFLCELTGKEIEPQGVIKYFMDRHEVLRTKLMVKNNRIMQGYDEVPEIKLDTVSVESVHDIDFNKYLTKFDLMKGSLMKMTLFIDKNNERILMFDVHHILLDGYASSLLQSEFSEYYMTGKVSEPAVQYREYIAYEQQVRQSDKYREMQKYWIERLEGYQAPSIFEKTGKKATPEFLTVTLDEQITQKVQTVSGMTGVTVFSVFAFVVNLVLSDMWKLNDNVFLTPTMNRNKKAFKKMLGVCINLLAFRSRLDDNMTVKEQIKDIFLKLHGDMENQEYQYNDLIDTLKEKQMNTQFNMYMDFEDESLKVLKDRDLILKLNQLKYDIDVVIKKHNGTFDIGFAYNSTIFDKASVDEMSEKIKQVISLLPEYINADETVGGAKQKLVEMKTMD